MTDEPRSTIIKEAVREGYTTRLRTGSCCGSACGPLPLDVHRATLAHTLGYTAGDLAEVPEGAVRSSFGCGNPLAHQVLRPGDVVLDIGSGAGIDCLLAAAKVAPTGRVIGLDMTPAMVAAARENARQAGVTTVEFRLGDAEAMPVDDHSVDWVISNCVINLAPDKPRVFHEVVRVLRPGGRVSISDIVFADDMPELPAAVRADLEVYVGCVAGAVSESAYLGAMRAAGLEDVAVVERLAYGDDVLASFLAQNAGHRDEREGREDAFSDLRHAVSGRIWSVRVTARKPSQPALPGSPQPGAASTDSPSSRKWADAEVAPARREDLPGVEKLLRRCGLPTVGVAGNTGRFLVVREGSQVVGCVGFEPYGPEVLLRSLAVAPESRGRGLGRRLFREVLLRVRDTGFARAVLLTHSVQSLAANFGFRAVDRAVLSGELLASWEFQIHGCDGADVLALDLERVPLPLRNATGGNVR